MSATVLVVDDEPDLRFMLRWALERRIGAVVVEAATGAQALDVLDHHRPGIDVVVLDLALPDLDGWTVLDAMRERPLARDVPVIVASAYSDSAARERAERSGCAGYLVKPFAPLELTTLIERLVAGTAAGGEP